MDRPNIKDFVKNKGGSGEFVEYSEYSKALENYIYYLQTHQVKIKDCCALKQHCSSPKTWVNGNCAERKVEKMYKYTEHDMRYVFEDFDLDADFNEQLEQLENSSDYEPLLSNTTQQERPKVEKELELYKALYKKRGDIMYNWVKRFNLDIGEGCLDDSEQLKQEEPNTDKEEEYIISPHGTKFKKGQKVSSYGDETTYGWIYCWNHGSGLWQLTTEEKGGFKWWPDDEPKAWTIQPQKEEQVEEKENTSKCKKCDSRLILMAGTTRPDAL